MSIVTAFGLVGCGSVTGTADPGTQVSDLPASTPSPTPDTEAVTAAILAAFGGYNNTINVLYARSGQVRPGEQREQLLRRYAAGPVVGNDLTENAQNRSAGVAFRGRRGWTGRVTSLQLDNTPPTADLRLCIDYSSWYPVKVATGKSARAADWPTKLLSTARAREVSGRWYIVAYGPVPAMTQC
jgi:hypothetical protein